MQILITGRNFELTDDIRSYVQKKVEKVEKFFDQILEANVVLEIVKHRHLAEITLMARRAEFHAETTTEDIFSSIDAVVDKLENQIRRFKERIKDKRHRAKTSDVVVQLAAAEMETTPEVVDSRNALRDEASFSPQIVRVEDRFPPKPMTPEEAAMQLSLSDDDFLVFLNAQTEQVNVLYKRRNGSFGWIEPGLT